MKSNNKESLTRQKLLDAAFLEVYINGYNAASTTNILKTTKIPKGSMYHYFKSKKELVIAVINERIFLKMDDYFDFRYYENKTVYKTLEDTYIKISNNEILIKNGCPLHRLIVEMSSVDEDFNKVLNTFYKQFIKKLSFLLQKGIENKEFIEFNTEQFAKYIITSTWGALSIASELSSKQEFINNSNIILETIKNKSKL